MLIHPEPHGRPRDRVYKSYDTLETAVRAAMHVRADGKLVSLGLLWKMHCEAEG